MHLRIIIKKHSIVLIMADEDEVISANNNDEVFEYMGGDMVVPDDVVRAQVHPSITVIPEKAFYKCKKLEEIDLCEGLLEIGEYAFSQCSSLKRIQVPSSVTKICDSAFENCKRLEEIELCEGLTEIGNDAFYDCKSLKHVNIPPTVKTIGSFAFCGAQLQTLHLPDSVERIRHHAFSQCRFPNVRIPPLVTTIAARTSSNCSSMFSAELPETITQIAGGGVFDNCRSLRNVAVPPHAVVGVDTFQDCTDLLQLFDSESQVINALKHRFDNLPIHKMVYYQSYDNLTVDLLKDETKMRSNHSRALRIKLDPTGNQQDCLGMTPLHILACSKVQNIELYHVLIKKYPENLITEDRWGAVPLFYAVWGNASSEIVQFLVESYKSIYPSYEFDWTGMITTLGEKYALESSIHNLLDLQKLSFPAQKIDWDRVLNTLANVVDTGSSAANASLKITFQILVKVSISIRVDAIGLKQWRDDVDELMAEPIPCRQSKGDWLNDVKSKLSHYEAEYQKLKEATTTLELALWKMKLDELNCQGGKGETQYNKKRKIEDVYLRSQFRISCGADIVIEHVLPYLVE